MESTGGDRLDTGVFARSRAETHPVSATPATATPTATAAATGVSIAINAAWTTTAATTVAATEPRLPAGWERRRAVPQLYAECASEGVWLVIHVTTTPTSLTVVGDCPDDRTDGGSADAVPSLGRPAREFNSTDTAAVDTLTTVPLDTL